MRGKDLNKAYDTPRARFEDSRIEGDFQPCEKDPPNPNIVGTLHIENESRWLALSVSWISGKLEGDWFGTWWSSKLADFNSSDYHQTGQIFPPADLRPGTPYQIDLGYPDGGVHLTFVFRVAADGRNGDRMAPGTIFEFLEGSESGKSEPPFRAPSRKPAQ